MRTLSVIPYGIGNIDVTYISGRELHVSGWCWKLAPVLPLSTRAIIFLLTPYATLSLSVSYVYRICFSKFVLPLPQTHMQSHQGRKVHACGCHSAADCYHASDSTIHTKMIAQCNGNNGKELLYNTVMYKRSHAMYF